MSASWPTSVATDATLYIAVNALQTTLSGSIDNVTATITLASATGFPTAGAVTIDNEVVFYTGISGANLTGCVRGSDGTTAASHSSGVPVGATIVAFHHNGLKDEVIAIESSLNLTASRAVVTNSSGRVAVSAVTSTELGYVAGVTSAIQTQIDGKVSSASPTFTGVVTIADGSAALPSLVFTGDSDTGFYWIGANDIGISTGGTLKLEISTSNVTAYLPVTVNGNTTGDSNYGTISSVSLGQYYEGSFTATFTGPFSSGSKTIKYVRIGRQVTLFVPAFTGTSTSATNFTASAVIPSNLRPSVNQYFTLFVEDNNAFPGSPGIISAETSGTIEIFRANDNNNFTAGSSTCGPFLGATITYILG